MSNYELAAGQFLLPTPAGAFHAVSVPGMDSIRHLLYALMSQDVAPQLNIDSLREWTQTAEDETAMELLHRAQSLALVQGESTSREAPSGPLEQILPSLLAKLSSSGKALFADSQGFYIASQGFPHETAEELSALSADLAALHARHNGLLHGNIGLPTSSWALVDAWGNSQLGFWPLYIGEQRFVLVLAGQPLFNQAAFLDLVWALSKRYANVELTKHNGPAMV